MYQTLYRKYRPKNFYDVIGQDSIVKTLTNSIKNDKVSHAYMFFGPRGVGKTSIAKIFARTVNCMEKNGNLCNKCDCCVASNSKECLDIIEIDAASNNGVDEIRELRDKVNLLPNQLRYKVYIIDEVHMLTIQAFNALLKTLEEPPAHIIFILATTDPQKVPETIVSRCQTFSFNRIGTSDIVKNLKLICEKEKIQIDDEVLNRIASSSNGGMRDSIGMLDKLYSYCDDKITMNDFYELNNIVSDDDISELFKNIYEGNINAVLHIIDEWNDGGINIVQLVDNTIVFLKNMVVKLINEPDNIYSDINKIIKLLNLLNERMFDFRKSGNPKIYLEILLLEFMNNYKNISREIISNSDKVKEISEKKNIKLDKIPIESSNSKENTNLILEEKPTILNISEIIMSRVNNAFAGADKSELNNDKKKFQKLMDYTFDQKIGYLACSLLDSKIRVCSSDIIVISYEYDSVVSENLNNLDDLTSTLKTISSIDKKLAIVSDSEWDRLKNEYVSRIKNNNQYVVIEEPKPVYNDINMSKVNNNSSLIDTFGGIVEVE